MSAKSLIELHHVAVALDGITVLRDISWQLRPGEQWAILGGNGSGKSTFLKLVRGELWPRPGKGQRIYRLGGVTQTTSVGVRERISSVSPELQERYLQQEWRLTAQEVVYSGFQNGDYVYRCPTEQQKRVALQIIQQLAIEHLLHRNVQQLSTGELRKVLIARALAGGPDILALDEACDGLDGPSRNHLLDRLEALARGGIQLLLATHRREELLPSTTHVLLLEKGRMVASGPRSIMGLPVSTARVRQRINHVSNPRRAPTAKKSRAATILRIKKADVFLERKKILHRIEWEIRSGENWVVLGPNGAGKSTLLKLAFGALQAAWGGNVSRFHFTSKNTIWQVKRRIGYVAPDLQADYRRRVSGAEVVASGFYGSIGLHERLRPEQKRRIDVLLDTFGAKALAGKTAAQLSYGELRKLLLLRALVHEPRILICDEPFDGLDPAARTQLRGALDAVARGGTQLVIVTHHVGDIPKSVTHGLLLQDGRIVIRGYLEEVRAHSLTQRLIGEYEYNRATAGSGSFG